jgi:hypothetical protein
MSKYSYTKENRIEFKEIHSGDSFTHGFINPEDEHALINSGVDIAEYMKPQVTNEELRGEVLAELKALDADTRTIEGAILGDEHSIDKIKKAEKFKIRLRKKLAKI